MTKEIPLTQGMVALVDDEEYDRLVTYTWWASKKATGRWYAMAKIDNKMVYMHRLIVNTLPGFDTDHINGNRLDNRRANLRTCSRSQNNANRHLEVAHTSEFRGVSWCESIKRWVAQTKHNGKHISIGVFESETEAARAYDFKALELFGPFAHFNFPGEVSDPKAREHTSRFRGVSRCSQKKCWRTQIRINGKNTCVGYFDSEVDAALAYNKKAIEFRGSNTRLNVLEALE